MYIPASFAETNPSKLFDAIERYSFATLVSTNGAEPFASHLPLLLERSPSPHGRLIGHMARANPHGRIADGQRVLAIFHGPHAYISPTWYEAQHVVPTWNYITVHVYGTLRIDENPEHLLHRVRKTVDHYEAGMPNPWSLESQDAIFIDRMLSAIIGFEIEVDRIEGKWKLNQNHAVERRKKVMQALRKQGDPESLNMADWMADVE